MKKTSINILCVLIIVILAGSVLTPAYYLGSVFFMGVRHGFYGEMSETAETTGLPGSYDPSSTVPVDVSFQPDFETMIKGNEIIMFGDDSYPTALTRATLMVPSEKWDNSLSWTAITLYVACFVLFILLLIQFIRFIVNINRGNIFVRGNVMRLRRFAWYLISIAVLKCIAGIIEDCMFSRLDIRLDGYTLSTYWTMPWGTLMLGLLALVMAQIWSRGLEMREEQDLTI